MFGTACLLTAAIVLAPADKPRTSTREDFKAYCQANLGRWVGEVTWVTDWPGLGKKGEKVTAYGQATLSEDGNLLVGKFYGGQGSISWFTYFDPGTRQIRTTSVDAGGTVSEGVITREDSRWVETGRGATADGKKYTYTSRYDVSDNGNTQTVTGTASGDLNFQDQKDVWRRVSKTPSHVQTKE